jgi:hypothetical protein
VRPYFSEGVLAFAVADALYSTELMVDGGSTPKAIEADINAAVYVLWFFVVRA